MENVNREMISFEQKGVQFNYRAAAVILNESQVLLHRAETDSFWALPGGRVEMMEDAAATIVREMDEELGIKTEVDRLMWVAENFYSHNGQQFHELGLYFLLRLPDGPPKFDEQGHGYGYEEMIASRLIFKWFPCDRAALESAPLLPAFLIEGLVNLPMAPTHIVETA